MPRMLKPTLERHEPRIRERQLSIRERLWLKGLIAGESMAQAARNAGYSAATARSSIYRKLPLVKVAR